MRGESRRLPGRSMAASVLLAGLLAGCSMAPTYTPPSVAAPQQYKEVAGWTQAQPNDAAMRGNLSLIHI